MPTQVIEGGKAYEGGDAGATRGRWEANVDLEAVSRC
jgi:hypothetical protein